MSEFTVLASRGAPDSRRRLEAVARAFSDVYGDAATDILGDGAVSCLIMNESDGDIRRFECDRGWVVLKGVAFDGEADGATPSPERIFDGLLNDRRRWLARLQGAFALAAWFGERRELLALNDHAATLNLYVGAIDHGYLVATAILAPARAFGIAPAPAGVREYLARGALMVPGSFFSGIDRLGVGQCATLAEGGWSFGTHWEPFADTSAHFSPDEAVTAYASALVRAVERIHAATGRLAVDLTAGYDSRMVVAAALHAGMDFVATTGRAPDEIERAARLARRMGIEHAVYGADLFERLRLTPDTVRELIHRTAGERDFLDIAHASISLDMLHRRGRVRLQGCGGELTRARPWSHELWNAGKTGPPDIGRLLRFRLLSGGAPPDGLYRGDWWPRYVDDLAHRARRVFTAPARATRAQRLDAIHIWQETGNGAISLSSTHGWMPAVHPLFTRGVMEAALAIPWRWKLGARVTRAVTHRLSPALAALPTRYGGTAAPLRPSTLHLEARHALNRTGHVLARLDRQLAGGRLTRPFFPPPDAGPRPALPDTLLALLSPDEMLSRALFDPRVLATLLAEGADDPARQRHVSRILNVELLFRECGFRPDAAFLDAARDPAPAPNR